MKTKNLLNWSCLIGVGLACLFLAGCKTEPYKKGDATSEAFRKAAMDVQAETRAIDDTVAALDSLVANSGADMGVLYNSYLQAVKRLDKATQRTQKSGAAVEKRGNAYLAAWDEQLATMTYDAVRNQSRERREAIAASLQAANQRFAEAQEAVTPLASYLGDISKALGSDLTAEGVKAVEPISKNAKENATKVQTALSGLKEQLEELAKRLSTGTNPGTKL
jgi:septation ring formation regulator EzrA